MVRRLRLRASRPTAHSPLQPHLRRASRPAYVTVLRLRHQYTRRDSLWHDRSVRAARLVPLLQVLLCLIRRAVLLRLEQAQVLLAVLLALDAPLVRQDLVA